MSLAKKEEVCSQRLVPRLGLGEPPVDVPFKKRPVFMSDKSAAPAMPLSIKPPSPAKEMSTSATGAGCGEELFFNIAKSNPNVSTKGKGITDTQIQDHADMAFTALSMTNGSGVLFNGSTEIPSNAESDTRTIAPADESQHQNFLALDLQSPSHRDGKNNNYSSLVKEEKVDQGPSGFSSAEPHNNVHVANGISASCNSIVGRLPNLDLNVPLDPADSHESLPTMQGSGSVLYHGTIQYQKAQVTPETPISTISSGLGQSIGSTLSMSDAYGLSHKRAPVDVTLDLQLKPPARPELGINWKGLTPAPELRLSLFGKPVDEPKSLGAHSALFDSGTAGSSKKVGEETSATPGSGKAPVEKVVTLGPCPVNPKNTTSATVSGIDQMSSNNLVKKEPEETSQQHIPNSTEKEHLLERPSAEPVNNCAESQKAGGLPQGPSKTGIDLNSDFFPNKSTNNGLDVATDNIPIPPENLPDISQAKTKFVKHKESMSATPSSAVKGSRLSALLMEAKSLPLQSNVASPTAAQRESSGLPTVSTVCKPTASHIHAHEGTRQRPYDVNEARDALLVSSKPTAEPLIRNSRNKAVIDGMSQGSAEMDCSDDDTTISRIPTTNKPRVGPSGNGPNMVDGINSGKVLKKEQDSDMHQDSSIMTNKIIMEAIDGEKTIKMRAGVGSHANEEGLRNEVFDSEKSKDKQPLNSDKDTSVNNTDTSTNNAKTATGSSSTDLQRSSALPKSASLKLQSTKQSPKTSDTCIGKTRSPDIKSDMPPIGKQGASSGENNVKIAVLKTECQTESEEVARRTDLCPRESGLGEDSELDGASSSQQHSACGMEKSASEKSEHDKSKPDSCKTSIQNERDGQLVGAHWRELGHAYVNRNERWERLMESEREKNNGECHGGRHASDMITHHRGGWRGAGPRGHPRNFRGPRMNNEFSDEPISGRRHSFEDEPGHFHQISHRRRRSPLPSCLMRDVDIDSFHGREIPDPRLLDHHGQMEELPDDIVDDRFFIPHSHRHRGQGDHGFMRRERSHSPAQRRGGHLHFHRGRSPEVMHRSPPLMRTERPYLPHRHHSGSHDARGGMQQRSARRRSMEGDTFEPPLHPAHLAELCAEDELEGRRKYRDRRAYLRSPVSEEDDVLSYHTEDDMEFAEGSGCPRDHDVRFRNRLGHNRARGEHQDGYRHRGPQGWREGDSNDNRPKRRRY